jgi:hypothetical protein
MAATAYLPEAPTQTAAVKHDVWDITKSLHTSMGVTITNYTTTSPQAMLNKVVGYAQTNIAISYRQGTGFASQQAARHATGGPPRAGRGGGAAA